jgi:hypothetical protein
MDLVERYMEAYDRELDFDGSACPIRNAGIEVLRATLKRWLRRLQCLIQKKP